MDAKSSPVQGHAGPASVPLTAPRRAGSSRRLWIAVICCLLSLFVILSVRRDSVSLSCRPATPITGIHGSATAGGSAHTESEACRAGRGRPTLWGVLESIVAFCRKAFSSKHGCSGAVPSKLPGSRGGVASESKICSQIGIDILSSGGNAADAMVGTTLCVGVMGMYHSGIGGGGFLLVRDKHGNYESVDYRETAPAAAFEDMYKDNIDGSVYGGLSVGVPGELRGLEYLHKKHGCLPWATIVQPAVNVARNGFPVNEDLARFMNGSTREDGSNFLRDDPVWSEDFAPSGVLLKVGETMTRKRYANTLEAIGKYGVNVFYTGKMAQSMIDIIQATNGTMTLEDLEEYSVVAKKALSIDYRGFRVFATRTPSSGVVTLSILKTMEQYDLEDQKDVNLTTHRFTEAMRFAYGARQSLGDPGFVSNMDGFESELLSEDRARNIKSRIRDYETLPVEEYGTEGFYANEGHGTSHIVTVDGSGMAVTSTTTVNLIFGAKIMTPDTGIILNNEMNDFAIPGVNNSFGYAPAPPNYIRPRKRPLSTTTPLIAEYLNGTFFLATGSAGGSRIVSATALAAWHVIEHGMTMQDAITEPRMHDQLMPNHATFEWSFDNSTIASMEARGHVVERVPPIYSSAQGVLRQWNGVFEAARETRQKSSAGLVL